MLPDATVEDIFGDLIEEATNHLLDEYRDFAGKLHSSSTLYRIHS